MNGDLLCQMSRPNSPLPIVRSVGEYFVGDIFFVGNFFASMSMGCKTRRQTLRHQTWSHWAVLVLVPNIKKAETSWPNNQGSTLQTGCHGFLSFFFGGRGGGKSMQTECCDFSVVKRWTKTFPPSALELRLIEQNNN